MSKFKKGDIPAIIAVIVVLALFVVSCVLKISLLFFIPAAGFILFALICHVFEDIKVEMKTPFAIGHPVLFWLAKSVYMSSGIVVAYFLIFFFAPLGDCFFSGDLPEKGPKLWEAIWLVINLILFIPSYAIFDRIEREKKQYCKQ